LLAFFLNTTPSDVLVSRIVFIFSPILSCPLGLNLSVSDENAFLLKNEKSHLFVFLSAMTVLRLNGICFFVFTHENSFSSFL